MKTSNVNKMTEVPGKGVILVWKKDSVLHLLNICENLEKPTFSRKISILSYSKTNVVKQSPSWKNDPRAASTNLPGFYETHMVIITFTRAHNLTPIYPRSIHTTTSHAVPPGWIWFLMPPSNSTKVLLTI